VFYIEGTYTRHALQTLRSLGSLNNAQATISQHCMLLHRQR
jgi:hypothetical protein